MTNALRCLAVCAMLLMGSPVNAQRIAGAPELRLRLGESIDINNPLQPVEPAIQPVSEWVQIGVIATDTPEPRVSGWRAGVIENFSDLLNRSMTDVRVAARIVSTSISASTRFSDYMRNKERVVTAWAEGYVDLGSFEPKNDVRLRDNVATNGVIPTKYGTHYVKKMALEARVTVYFEYALLESEARSEATAKLAAAAKWLTGQVKLEASTEQEARSVVTSGRVTVYMTVLGGNPDVIFRETAADSAVDKAAKPDSRVQLDPTTSADSFERALRNRFTNWSKTVTPKNAAVAWYDCVPLTSLLPNGGTAELLPSVQEVTLRSALEQHLWLVQLRTELDNAIRNRVNTPYLTDVAVQRIAMQIQLLDKYYLPESARWLEVLTPNSSAQAVRDAEPESDGDRARIRNQIREFGARSLGSALVRPGVTVTAWGHGGGQAKIECTVSGGKYDSVTVRDENDNTMEMHSTKLYDETNDATKFTLQVPMPQTASGLNFERHRAAYRLWVYSEGKRVVVGYP